MVDDAIQVILDKYYFVMSCPDKSGYLNPLDFPLSNEI